MWCMVGGNHFDSAILYTFYQCITVSGASDRWVHFPAAFFLQVHIAECKVVRSCFTGYRQSFCLCLSYNVHSFLCGNVAHVVLHTCFFYQFYVTGYLSPFTFRADATVTVEACIFTVVDVAAIQQFFILAVCNDWFVYSFGFNHSFFHHFFFLYAFAVVRESKAFVSKRSKVHQLCAFLSFCDRSIRQDCNQSVGIDDILFLFQCFDIIWNRVKVWHAAHKCEAPSGCCRSA